MVHSSNKDILTEREALKNFTNAAPQNEGWGMKFPLVGNT